MKVRGKAKTVASFFQRTDGFLKSLFVIFADGHHLAYGFHLSSKFILGAFKFFKGPPGKLDNYIISGRLVFLQSSFFPVRDLVQGQSCGQKSGYIGDREACGLAGKGRRTGGSGIDFDDDNTAGLGIMGKLYVGAADNADGFNNGMGLLFQFILNILGNSQHRCSAERISGVDAHGVNILNETYRNLLTLCVTDNLYFQFFPADDRFFDQDLVYHRGGNSSGSNFPKLFFVVDDSSSGSPHGIGRADDTGIP